jgi:hypothetical protein
MMKADGTKSDYVELDACEETRMIGAEAQHTGEEMGGERTCMPS